MEATFRTNKGTKTGEVLKINHKTVWVKFEYKKKILDAFKTAVAVVKRHKLKHNVVLKD
jgi:hypothetical protein